MIRLASAIAAAALLSAVASVPVAAQSGLTLGPHQTPFPLHIHAHLRCQTATFTGFSSVSAAGARADWIQRVGAALGPAWNIWRNATDREETVVAVGSSTRYIARARPCRGRNLTIAP